MNYVRVIAAMLPRKNSSRVLPTRRRFIGSCTSGSAALLLVKARAETAGSSIAPFRVEGDAVVVSRATYFVAGKQVKVRDETVLPVDAVDVATVRDEELQLGDKRPSGFFTGTRLHGTRTKSIGAFRALIADSVVVHDASGRALKRGEDFLVSPAFGLIGIGPKPSIAPTDSVYATYSHYLQRIDAIVVDTQGQARLVRGEPELATPRPPETAERTTVIGHVYRPLGGSSAKLSETQVFPIVAGAHEARTETVGRLPATLGKLRAGERVKVLCWGDSITVGADVEPQEAWPNRMRDELTRAFPQAQIEHVNHSIGGTKSAQWLHPEDFPALQSLAAQRCRFEHILNEEPNVVVMEFLNDVTLDADTLQRTYAAIDAQFRARGIEWLIVTPSQKMPETFDLAEMKDGRPRMLDGFLREFAQTRGHALADAAARWKHLHREGIPYFTLFNNAYNHPNAFGHGLFVEEIMKCFGVAKLGA